MRNLLGTSTTTVHHKQRYNSAGSLNRTCQDSGGCAKLATRETQRPPLETRRTRNVGGHCGRRAELPVQERDSFGIVSYALHTAVIAALLRPLRHRGVPEGREATTTTTDPKACHYALQQRPISPCIKTIPQLFTTAMLNGTRYVAALLSIAEKCTPWSDTCRQERRGLPAALEPWRSPFRCRRSPRSRRRPFRPLRRSLAAACVEEWVERKRGWFDRVLHARCIQSSHQHRNSGVDSVAGRE